MAHHQVLVRHTHKACAPSWLHPTIGSVCISLSRTESVWAEPKLGSGLVCVVDAPTSISTLGAPTIRVRPRLC
jgi:hypothetical protein